jgi:hypothetical protein
MPRRDDLSSILLIGSGPIVIGQACEFDYSGTQACRALREEGYRVILVNSNPATIMTDPDMADATYISHGRFVVAGVPPYSILLQITSYSVGGHDCPPAIHAPATNCAPHACSHAASA